MEKIFWVLGVTERYDSSSMLKLSISENHKLLYFNIPKELIKMLHLTENDLLEYDIRGNQFYCRKKGSEATPRNIDTNLFAGLRVERTITRNNTILRTNLPKEVAQPLSIQKGDKVEIALEKKVLIGKKITKND